MDRRLDVTICALLWVMLCTGQQAHGAATISEVQSFLGGRTGKIVARDKGDTKLYIYDLTSGKLTKLSDDLNCNGPLISPDGTRVVYSQNGTVYIRTIGSTDKKTVVAGGVYEPHWFIDSNKDEWIYYTTQGSFSSDKRKLYWPNANGVQTYRIRLKDSTKELVLDWKGSGGPSTDGTHIGAGYSSMIIFDGSGKEHIVNGGSQGCNPSMHPDSVGGNYYMMHLELPHDTFCYRDKSDNRVWYVLKPSGTDEWQNPEWSNDADYATATAKESNTLYASYIVRISEIDGKTGKIVSGKKGMIQVLDTSGGRDWAEPYLWVDKSTTPPPPPPAPKLGLSPTSLTFSGTEGGSDPGSKTISVSNTGGETLSTVTTSTTYGGDSGWLTVTKGGSDNSQSLKNSVDISGLTPNTYTATVKVSSTGATNSPQSYTVTLTVKEQPTPDAGVAPTTPKLSLDPVVLTFTVQAGTTSPPAQTVSVANSGVGTLADLKSTVSYVSGSGWLSVAASGSGNSQSLENRVDVTGLVPDTYSATVEVSASGATNSPQSYAVSLTVTEGPSTTQADSGGSSPDGGVSMIPPSLNGGSGGEYDDPGGETRSLVGGCAVGSRADDGLLIWLLLACLLWSRTRRS